MGLTSCSCEHNWTETSDTATCTSSGIVTYTCTKCKNTKTESSSIKEHNWSLISTTVATCENAGTTKYTCTNCRQTKTESVPAKGHDWVLTSNTVTCENAGIATYTCSNCKQTKIENVSAKGHDYSNGDNCSDCGRYKYNIAITNTIPCDVSYKGVNITFSKATINLIEFHTSYYGKVFVHVEAKKTYDYQGEAGTNSVAFNIKIVCTTDNEILGNIRVYKLNLLVGQTFSFDETFNIYADQLSTSKMYAATIFDYV